MRARTTLAGLMLGASLLGVCFALGQESPRPRPVVPPDEPTGAPIVVDEEMIRGAATALPNKPAPGMPLPILTEPAPPTITRVQNVQAPGMLPDLPPVIPAVGTMPDVPPPIMPPTTPSESSAPPGLLPIAPPTGSAVPPIMPPIAPDLTAPPPPQPAAPQTMIAPPDLPKLPTMPAVSDPPVTVAPMTPPVSVPEKSAPVTPWSPPKDKTPDLPPTPPTVSPPNTPSRFVVPRSGTKRPNEDAPRPPVPLETPRPATPEAPIVPRFEQVKIFRTASPSPMTAPIGNGTTTGFERHTPTPFAPSVEVGSAQTVTPQLTIEKRGPFYQKAGATLAYQIFLRNIGSTTAVDVRVEDEIPGMTRKRLTPEPNYAGGDRLAWVVPSLRPGEEKMILLELVPNRPGDLVSTTSVVITQSTSFRTKQEDDGDRSRTRTTPPVPENFDLPPLPKLDTTVPEIPAPAPKPESTPAPVIKPPIPAPSPVVVEVKPIGVIVVGQKLTLEVMIANRGTEAIPAKELMLIGTLPAGLTHPAGDSIGADLPGLAPGETKTFKMPMTAAQPGSHTVEIRVKTKDNEIVTRPQVEVVGAPQPSTSNAAPTGTGIALPTPGAPGTVQPASSSGLQLQVQGRDAQLGLGRETIVVVNLANPGAMPASNVQLTLFLSEGLEATTRAQGPMPYQIAGKRIFFTPITRMPENGKYLFHVGVRGIGSGDQVVRVQVTSDQERTPTWREVRLSVR